MTNLKLQNLVSPKRQKMIIGASYGGFKAGLSIYLKLKKTQGATFKIKLWEKMLLDKLQRIKRDKKTKAYWFNPFYGGFKVQIRNRLLT